MQVFNFLWPSKGKKQDETFYGLCARCHFARFSCWRKIKTNRNICVCWPFTLSILTPVGDFPRLLTTEQVVTGLFVDDDDVKHYKLQCIVMLYWDQSPRISLWLWDIWNTSQFQFFTIIWVIFHPDLDIETYTVWIPQCNEEPKQRTFQKASQVPFVPWKVLKSTKAQSI